MINSCLCLHPRLGSDCLPESVWRNFNWNLKKKMATKCCAWYMWQANLKLGSELHWQESNSKHCCLGVGNLQYDPIFPMRQGVALVRGTKPSQSCKWESYGYGTTVMEPTTCVRQMGKAASLKGIFLSMCVEFQRLHPKSLHSIFPLGEQVGFFYLFVIVLWYFFSDCLFWCTACQCYRGWPMLYLPCMH